MNIYAIADLHLSGQPPAKPMEIFGINWRGHWAKIHTSWLQTVTPDDYVLLAGDTSWGLKLDDALPDLLAIAALPGKKILIKGNHDYWWQSLRKMQCAVENKLIFLQNNFVPVGNWAICGSRGWICPDDPFFNPDDLHIFQREALRLRLSLESAVAAGFRNIIVMLHYPPVFAADNAITNLLQEFNVTYCLYGHLHGETQNSCPPKNLNNTLCCLTACDSLGFQLKKIIGDKDIML